MKSDIKALIIGVALVVGVLVFALYCPETTTEYYEDNIICKKVKGWYIGDPVSTCYFLTPLQSR